MTEQTRPQRPAAPIKAISLLSGGLDSILATRLVQDQGVEVLALHFITPFFGDDKRGREAEIVAFYRDTYGIDVRIVDVAEEFLHVLGNPQYGYGKNFNPCVDCKIFLIRKAVEIMRAEGARFIITGEVLGQRPMSQRRDAMNAIAKQTGIRDILLRPLSAQRLPPTKPELEGWVDRNRLCGFSGRSRKPQMELAEALGIAGYPTPAGGCRLTDPTLAERVRRYFECTPAEERRPGDIRFLFIGRPFRFPGGSLLSVGRNHGENLALKGLAAPGDLFLKARDVTGPLGLLRPVAGEDVRDAAASVLLRYCPKAGPRAAVVIGPDPERMTESVEAAKATDAQLQPWRV